VQFKDYIGRSVTVGNKICVSWLKFSSSARRDPFEDLDIECISVRARFVVHAVECRTFPGPPRPKNVHFASV
jgi:hypothetical protein